MNCLSFQKCKTIGIHRNTAHCFGKNNLNLSIDVNEVNADFVELKGRAALLFKKFVTAFFIGCLLLASSLPSYATKGIVSDEAEPHFSSQENQETFEDLRVKVLGSDVRMTRIWNGASWVWNERWQNISFSETTASTSAIKTEEVDIRQVFAVYRGGQLYRRVSQTAEKTIFENQLRNVITKTAEGFVWTDRSGDGIRYNNAGQLISYFDRQGVNVFLVRGDDGYLAEIKDHHQNTVITYAWETVPPIAGEPSPPVPVKRLKSLTDYTGRRVAYEWNTANQLVGVTDVRGETWVHTYDDQGQLTQLKDPEGRITRYSIDKRGRFTSRVNADGVGVSYESTFDKQKGTYYSAEKTTAGQVNETWYDAMGQVERSTQNGEDQGSVSYVLSDNSAGVGNLVQGYSSRVEYWYKGSEFLGKVIIACPSGGVGAGVPVQSGSAIGSTLSASATNVATTVGCGADPRDPKKLQPLYIKFKKDKDARGNTTTTEYDQWKNVVSITHPDGSRMTQTWHNQYALPLTKTDERGVVTAYEYDAKGNLLTLTEAKGTPDQRITRYTYDEFGQVKTKTTGESTANNTALATVKYNYDELGNITEMTDAENHITRYSDFDALGNAKTQMDARAHLLASNAQYTWTKTFDAAGDVLTILDPYGRGTTYTYTKSGDLQSLTPANGSKVTFTNNANGQPLTATDLNNKIIKMEYDKANRLFIVTDANGNKTQTHYDEQGRVKLSIDGENNSTQFFYEKNQLRSIQYPTFKELMDYDNRDRVKQTTQQANNKNYIRKRGYDQVSNLSNTRDALDKSNQYDYDKFNRVIKMTDANNGITQYTYDARDNLLEVKDPEDRLTIYTYDKNDRLLSETKDGDQNTTRKRVYAYDENGNLKSTINPDQEKTVYEYDHANRMEKSLVFAHKDHTKPIKVVTYNINDKTQLEGWSQQVSNELPENVTPTADVIALAENYTYTNLGQLETVTASFGNITKTYRYAYYPNGLKKTYTNPEGIIYTYFYNKNNQLIAVHIPGNGQITYADFDWLMPQTLLLPGGQKITYKYTDFLQVKERYLVNPSNQNLAQSLYEYDAENNITNLNTKEGAYIFGYDDLYRLKTTDVPASNPANDESFDYDGVGNRTAHSIREGETTAATTLNYNSKNQLTTETGAATATFTYTASGHTKTQTQSGVTTEYIYNHEKRLIAVKRNNQLIAEYAYNPQGQRVKKTVNGNTTWYLYNENGLAAEYAGQGCSSVAGAGCAGATNIGGALIKEYQFHPQKTWMTDPLFMRTAANDVYYYHNDHLGTPQQLLDSAGKIVWQATYSAFGKANITINAIENNLRFPGQYFDAETGLHQNFNRDYDPSIGRYIESDSTGLRDGMNTYGYARQSPLNLFDSKGLFAQVVYMVARVCARNPRLCAATLLCIKNPKACTDNMCKATCTGYQIACKSSSWGCNGSESSQLTGLKCAQGAGCCLMRSACNICRYAGFGHRKKDGTRDNLDQSTKDACAGAKKCCNQVLEKCKDCAR